MVFSSLNFIFLFLPAVLFFYFVIPAKWRNVKNLILLIFSLIFYAYGEPLGIFVMLISILGNYLFARLLHSHATNSQKAFFCLAVIFNLGILGYYKYTGFILGNINALFSTSLTIPQIIMPIGISFFTFQGLSYVFDVYRGTSKAQNNILNVATYISLFPQLVAGPIVRYSTIENELSERTESLDLAAQGVRRFIRGLAKKMLLANSLGVIATEMFAADPATLAASAAWLGALAYSFQIFYDFSGYSDMALGLGLIFGFSFPENFNYPYISKSISEFWTRWHMSLSSWFRDYVYIPLGGNRKGIKRQTLNILLVWMLTGLWHGAAWNFVIWGLYFALILILEKLFLGRLLQKIWAPLAHCYALLLILFGWVIFNVESLAHFTGYFSALLGFGASENTGSARFWLGEYKLIFLAAVAFSMPLLQRIPQKIQSATAYTVARDLLLLFLLMLCIMIIVNSSFNPFIYFRF